ncbi:DNA-binding transcriptional regulator, MarR family [Pseudomonas marincola]|jgi:DNA-binding MarR family transcriptional regulator|uniref:MarR family transcriptional regulator n=1 Tax=Pseudomonas marincola TaxID=437900 RepID=A0A1I7C2M6_9PSED|nr:MULTISPECIES: MarR family transcriptional regulator [Pseudomonas]NRH29602.1 MarR family transcriptional regulator [Pseudomonas sp. MS19]CAE6922266.1 DNA-binding transcriptional regulator, MarR family [Pseudomonas marincola]SFT93659.1 DNA-binding transcriptional regulator, MarR family [Pseudomonas marincola]
MKKSITQNFKYASIGLLVARAALLKDRLLDKHLAELDVTAAQFKVLIIIAQYELDTPADLCRYLALDSGSMTRMLDRLEQKKLLVRKRCATDRRQVRLALTASGLELAAHLPEVGAAAMGEFVGVLEPEEVQALEASLTKILLAVDDPIVALHIGAK